MVLQIFTKFIKDFLIYLLVLYYQLLTINNNGALLSVSSSQYLPAQWARNQTPFLHFPLIGYWKPNNQVENCILGKLY